MKDILVEDRRSFIKRASLGAMALPFLFSCRGDTWAQKSEPDILRQLKLQAAPAGTEAMGAIDAPTNVGWRAVLAATEGEPMIMSGTVYRADGKTPAPDTLIYFYHTDMYGIYGRGGEHKHGKYRGWMLTDKQGRYEFSSIRPASYPNTTFAAHVHMTITSTDRREDWIDSILFEGDRFISTRERESAGKRGGFNPIVKLERRGNIMHGVRDIQLV